MAKLTRVPRTAVFYSTVRHWGWGAPDYIWPIAAAELADRGIPTIAVVRPEIRDRPEIRALSLKGAKVVLQPPLIYRRGRFSELKALMSRFASSTTALRHALDHAINPHYFIEQSASYDFVDEPLLRQQIERTGASYDVLFHSNCYESPFPLEARKDAIAFLESAHRTLFNSQWTREVTEVQLLHHLTNADYFHHLVRFPHEAPLPWPADNILRLASVSRLDCHHKGLDVLLEALALLGSTLPEWTLDVFGRGPDEQYLRDLSRWLGLEARVRFRSHASDVRDVWRENHLLILVSRYEGLAVSMLEAMACGRPVLRTPYGGCAEWIVPGETGYVCPAAEPKLIADSLRNAILDHQAWASLGRAAHARIRTRLRSKPESIFLEPFGIAVAHDGKDRSANSHTITS